MKVRRRAFGIPLSALAEILTADARWHRVRMHYGVPEGAVPLHTYCEPNGRRVVVVFSHESFAESELDIWLAPFSAKFDHLDTDDVRLVDVDLVGVREVEPEPLDTLESLTAHVTKPRPRRPVRST